MVKFTEREIDLLRYALHKVWVSKSIKQPTRDEAHALWQKLFKERKGVVGYGRKPW